MQGQPYHMPMDKQINLGNGTRQGYNQHIFSVDPVSGINNVYATYTCASSLTN